MRIECRQPRCRVTVEPGDVYFPFCSERCQSADLSGWLEERYRVAADHDPLGELEADGDPPKARERSGLGDPQ